MKRCPRCAAEWDDRVKFCAHDGTALDPVIGAIPTPPAKARCPKCGAEVQGGRFCPHDGSFLEAVR